MEAATSIAFTLLPQWNFSPPPKWYLTYSCKTGKVCIFRSRQLHRVWQPLRLVPTWLLHQRLKEEPRHRRRRWHCRLFERLCLVFNLWQVQYDLFFRALRYFLLPFTVDEAYNKLYLFAIDFLFILNYILVFIRTKKAKEKKWRLISTLQYLKC